MTWAVLLQHTCPSLAHSQDQKDTFILSADFGFGAIAQGRCAHLTSTRNMDQLLADSMADGEVIVTAEGSG